MSQRIRTLEVIRVKLRPETVQESLRSALLASDCRSEDHRYAVDRDGDAAAVVGTGI